MEVDAGAAATESTLWKYNDQRYGMVLTGSSVASKEYVQFKSGLIEVGDYKGISGKGISLETYLQNN